MGAYEQARAAYWRAQQQFRTTAVAEIQQRMPDGVAVIILDINDTPRLSIIGALDANGADVYDEFEKELDELDQIAMDTEAFNWDEADSFLERDGDDRFRITRRTEP